MIERKTKQAVILQVLPALDGGGVERGTIEMAKAITNAGGKALIASAGGRLERQVHAVGATHITLPLHKKGVFSIWQNAQALKNIVKKYDVDIVHARSRAPAWAARLATRKSKTHFITTWHGVHSESFPGKKKYNAVLASGERVIAISHYIAQRLYQNYHVKEDRLRLIPRGADLDIFSQTKVKAVQVHNLASEWYVPIDTFVILLPARLTRWKGHEWLFQALGRLHQQGRMNRPWVCLCVGGIKGKEEYTAHLIRMAEKFGIAPNIRLTGYCEHMSVAYSLADIVVIPSLKPEPFGRTVVEAQAMERPVIVSAVGAMKETVLDGVNGYLVPPGNIEQLADRIAMLMAMSPAQRMDMGLRARMHIAQNFSILHMQHRTLHVYNELLPPACHLKPLYTTSSHMQKEQEEADTPAQELLDIES